MQNIIDIQVDNPKQQIRLNNDDDRIIELDLSDTGIIVRLNDGINAITELLNKRDGFRDAIADFKEDITEESGMDKFNEIVKQFAETEAEMKAIINKIFDYDVCTPFLGTASIFSVKNGVPMYEVIIDKLSSLYEDSIKKEAAKFNARISKHAGKYMKK